MGLVRRAKFTADADAQTDTKRKDGEVRARETILQLHSRNFKTLYTNPKSRKAAAARRLLSKTTTPVFDGGRAGASVGCER